MTDEYIRKSDAVNALKAQANTMRTWVERYAEQRRGILTAVNIVEDIKPADVVPVVRCKNCKHHAYDEIFSCYWCEYPGRVRDTTPDGFCEKGEE